MKSKFWVLTLSLFPAFLENIGTPLSDAIAITIIDILWTYPTYKVFLKIAVRSWLFCKHGKHKKTARHGLSKSRQNIWHRWFIGCVGHSELAMVLAGWLAHVSNFRSHIKYCHIKKMYLHFPFLGSFSENKIGRRRKFSVRCRYIMKLLGTFKLCVNILLHLHLVHKISGSKSSIGLRPVLNNFICHTHIFSCCRKKQLSLN